MEVPRIVLGPAGLQAPTGVTRAQGFDLDDFGAKPGEGFGAGGPSLELREVHDANILKTIEIDVHGHCPLSRSVDPNALASPCRPYQRPRPGAPAPQGALGEHAHRYPGREWGSSGKRRAFESSDSGPGRHRSCGEAARSAAARSLRTPRGLTTRRMFPLCSNAGWAFHGCFGARLGGQQRRQPAKGRLEWQGAPPSSTRTSMP